MKIILKPQPGEVLIFNATALEAMEHGAYFMPIADGIAQPRPLDPLVCKEAEFAAAIERGKKLLEEAKAAAQDKHQLRAVPPAEDAPTEVGAVMDEAGE